MIELKNLSKTYNQDSRSVTALDDVSLRVAPGEIYGVLGQSGAGKSTLIRCVNLLERPSGGQVPVEGRDMLSLTPDQLRLARQNIGMIFQHFNLFQSRTVAGNVAYPLEVAGWSKPDIQARVAELLALVSLSDKAEAYPSQLSGGQKQRVGIARSLASGPRILLSDEATSALDPETTRSVLGLLKEINQKLNLTILLITHQMEVVKEICDSVAILEKGALVKQGKVVDLIARPGSRLHELFYEPFQAAAWTRHPGSTLVAISFVGEINTNYYLEAQKNLKLAAKVLVRESAQNKVAVRKGDEARPEIQKLMKLLQSPEVKKFIEEKYQGAVTPAF